MVNVRVGGFYKTRDGRKFGPADRRDGFFSMNGWHYNCHGIHGYRGQTAHSIRKLDLISEWIDTPTEVIGENVRVIPINEAPDELFERMAETRCKPYEVIGSDVESINSETTPESLLEQLQAAYPQPRSKYHRIIKGVEVDIYDILVAWGVTCPARQHAIKKLLMAGERGAKGVEQDLDEAIQATERAKELVG